MEKTIICSDPECQLVRKHNYALTGAPCAACGTVYREPQPEQPAPKKDVVAAVALLFADV